MSLKKLSYNELIERLGIVMEQMTVIKRGMIIHKDDETFMKGALFMKVEFEEIMGEIIKRKHNEKK